LGAISVLVLCVTFGTFCLFWIGLAFFPLSLIGLHRR
jgi:hypothetical protein